jgi:hypothetical protein
MNKAKERREKFIAAYVAQAQCLWGEPGSAKNLAKDLLETLRRYSVFKFGRSTPEQAKEMLEVSRQDLVEALGTQSHLFEKITEIATALNDRNSRYFQKLADGLAQLPSAGFDLLPIEELDPMHFLHEGFMRWSCPTSPQWFSIWMPKYKKFVDKGLPPTKAQMREVTERLWAISRLQKRGELEEYCLPTEEMGREDEEKIKKEISKLPPQNWARQWKKSGLSHLKADRAGRPKLTQ